MVLFADHQLPVAAFSFFSRKAVEIYIAFYLLSINLYLYKTNQSEYGFTNPKNTFRSGILKNC